MGDLRKMEFETRLIKKVAKFPKVCTNCNNEIIIDALFHQDSSGHSNEGVAVVGGIGDLYLNDSL